jgi:hypothetical protein
VIVRVVRVVRALQMGVYIISRKKRKGEILYYIILLKFYIVIIAQV